MKSMPVVFIGHGSPMNAIQKNAFTEELKTLSSQIPKPRAILCVSAHWETQGTQVSSNPRPQTIHDFYGFPQALFQVQYPAPGSPELAQKIMSLAPEVKANPEYGFDHGSWSVLVHMYPDADIPVVQLSVSHSLSAQEHLELGKKLAPLRDDNVLIMATGNIVHNLRKLEWNRPHGGTEWTEKFDREIEKALLTRDTDTLVNYATKLAPEAQLAVPSEEHYLPLLYIYGASNESDTLSFPYEGYEMGSLSMRSVMYTAQ